MNKMPLKMPFHMVTKSPWPIITSINIFTMIIMSINWVLYKELMNMMLIMLIVVLCSIMWWKDMMRESTMQGNHTNEASNLMKMGMIMFISSEITLLTSLFWTFFHSSTSPNIELGMNWPQNQLLLSTR